MKIAIWADGFWCSTDDLGDEVLFGRSDDYLVVECPDEIEDIDAWALACVEWPRPLNG